MVLFLPEAIFSLIVPGESLNSVLSLPSHFVNVPFFLLNFFSFSFSQFLLLSFILEIKKKI